MNRPHPTLATRRLAIVLSHPTQYYSPWFRWLAAHTRLELRVFYLWDFGITARPDPRFQRQFKWDVDLLTGYDAEFVPNRSRNPGPETFRGFDNPTISRRLGAWDPAALLLFGYNYATHLRVIAWARRRGIPLVFRGDSHPLGRPAPRGLRRLLLAVLFRQFAAVTYVGVANREYFRRFGVSESRLHFAPHCVNHAWFDPGRPEVGTAAMALRRSLGFPPGTRVVLFAGKFVPAKQPRELLAAFQSLQRPDSALLFVGDGPERPALQELAGRSPGCCVRFLPFANQSEMPSRYAAADVFALPSRGSYETWGLAVNEAMHLGLPCLVSDRVGCQQDLVIAGETGWVFRADDPEHLRTTLAEALDGELPPRERILARISRYTYPAATAGLLQALTRIGMPDLVPSP